MSPSPSTSLQELCLACALAKSTEATSTQAALKVGVVRMATTINREARRQEPPGDDRQAVAEGRRGQRIEVGTLRHAGGEADAVHPLDQTGQVAEPGPWIYASM